MYEDFDIGHDLKMAFDDGYQAGLEAAAPKWISVVNNPPSENDIVFAYDYIEGHVALVKILEVRIASIDVRAIFPEHGVPFTVTHWTPLRFPELPMEEE